jgi:predicted esterase
VRRERIVNFSGVVSPETPPAHRASREAELSSSEVLPSQSHSFVTIGEHDRITRYAAALDQRMPASHFEHLEKWHRDGPAFMKTTLEDVRASCSVMPQTAASSRLRR